VCSGGNDGLDRARDLRQEQTSGWLGSQTRAYHFKLQVWLTAANSLWRITTSDDAKYPDPTHCHRGELP
jgi:hypothetical protein